MVCGGISDCDMEKGQLRCDANISVRPEGSPRLGTKVELKNLNSISFVRDGIAHEIRRQLAVVQSGGVIVQETRDYDGQTGASQSLRTKEQEHDYRYFPDPDLMPVAVDAAWKERIRSQCPELPFERQRRFFSEYGLPYTITSVLVVDRELSEYFEEAARLSADPLAVGNWVVNQFLRELGEGKLSFAELRRRVPPAAAAELVAEIAKGTVLTTAVAGLSAALFQADPPVGVRQAIEKAGLAQRSSGEDLERWCREAIAGNPKALADFKAGRDSAINGFKGPVMRAAKGKADPKAVDEMLRRLLKEAG